MLSDDVWPPPPVPVPARGAEPPYVVDQRPGPGNTVRVTWALPGLLRVTVTVPQQVWLVGGHAGIGRAAAGLMAGLLPDQVVDDGRDDGGNDQPEQQQ